MTPPDREAITTAQDLSKSLTAMAAEVKRLRTYGRRNRLFVLVDIALTAAVFLAGGIGIHAADQAATADSAQLALCRSSNVSRAQQVELWDYLLSLAQPPKTKQGRELIAKFEHHLHVVFAPRDCSSLGRNP